MSKKDFADQLEKLGYKVDQTTHSQFLLIDYEIEVGNKCGQKIKLGFAVGEDFPLNPPGGPHVSPRLFPIHPGGDIPHPQGAVNTSNLGDDWEYWSRPFQNWNQTDRTARTYMAHIRRLFQEI